MAKHFLEVAQKQRLDCLGTLDDSTQHVWLALHGYGQLVGIFSDIFEMVSPSRALLFRKVLINFTFKEQRSELALG